MAVGRFFGLILGTNLSGTDNGDGTITLDVLASGSDGWVDDTAETWTRTANQTFTVPTDLTTKYTKGTRLKWTQTTVKYGVVIASSHAGGTTTVTIATNTDYVLTAAAISANYHSYAVNPQGYPGWFNYAVTWGGFSVDPIPSDARFAVNGRVCHVNIRISVSGTSNATTLTFTAPIVAAVSELSMMGQCRDNAANVVTPPLISITAASATVSAFKDPALAAWTNGGGAGGKHIQGNFFYEI